MKIVNENKRSRGRGIRLVHWNKSNADLQNRMEEVKLLVNKYNPEVMGLSESNLKRSVDLKFVKIDDYELHTAPTLANDHLKISRVVVYTKSNLIVVRRHDLEDENISAIWLEIGMPRQKKILVANIYREWQFMGQENNQS